MRFSHSELASVFADIGTDPAAGGEDWAWAENVILEERIAPERLAEYEARADDLAGADLLGPTPSTERFRAYHDAHLRNRVFKPNAGGRAETFSPINRAALCAAPGKRTSLVRVEDLSRPMKVMGLAKSDARSAFEELRRTFRLFRELEHDDGTPALAAERRLRDWLNRWNKKRDARPVFAAPLSSSVVKAAFDTPDGAVKAAALRDLLGLGHLLPARREQPVFVAIVKYDVAVVLDNMNTRSGAEIRRENAFAAPTVLDGPLYPLFFPSPPDARVPGVGFGRTVHLDAKAGCGLAVEVLHPPFPYLPAHIHDIVEITDPGPSFDLRAARAAHVRKVRGEIRDAASFGAPHY